MAGSRLAGEEAIPKIGGPFLIARVGAYPLLYFVALCLLALEVNFDFIHMVEVVSNGRVDVGQIKRG